MTPSMSTTVILLRRVSLRQRMVLGVPIRAKRVPTRINLESLFQQETKSHYHSSWMSTTPLNRSWHRNLEKGPMQGVPRRPQRRMPCKDSSAMPGVPRQPQRTVPYKDRTAIPGLPRRARSGAPCKDRTALCPCKNKIPT